MDTARRKVMSGPIEARVQGAPAFRGRRDGADEPAVFPALPAALDWALRMIERHDLISASLAQGSSPWNTVGVVRVRDKQLLLVASSYTGDGPDRKQVANPAAEREVARLLPARGYQHVVVPEPATPLVTLGPLLPSRIVNLLMREGYTSVEQVTALPDAALHDLRSMGAIGISQLRAAIATLGLATPAAVPVTFTAEQASELARLLADVGALARAHDEHDLAERTASFTLLLPDGPAGLS